MRATNVKPKVFNIVHVLLLIYTEYSVVQVRVRGVNILPHR